MPKVIDVDALFESVVTVFADRGYAAATTQEIANRAGVNEVTLFRRYGSKAGLIGAALDHVLSRSAFAELAATDDVRADLSSIVARYDATNRAYGGAVMTLLTEAPRHPELRGALATLLPNMTRAAGIVASHQAAGRITPGDPGQKVALLLAPLIAGGLWERAGVGEIDGRFEPGDIVEGFLAGHGTPAG